MDLNSGLLLDGPDCGGATALERAARLHSLLESGAAEVPPHRRAAPRPPLGCSRPSAPLRACAWIAAVESPPPPPATATSFSVALIVSVRVASCPSLVGAPHCCCGFTAAAATEHHSHRLPVNQSP